MDVQNLECTRLDAQLFFFSLMHMIYLEIYLMFVPILVVAVISDLFFELFHKTCFMKK